MEKDDKMKLEDLLVILTKATIDKMLKEEKPADLIALYGFYYYTAKWQKTNTCKATISYCATGLKISRTRVSRARAVLIKLGLIQPVERRNKQGKIERHYTKVCFIFKKTTEKKITEGSNSNEPGCKNHDAENEGVDKKQPNALKDGSLNALSNGSENALRDNTLSPDGEEGDVSPESESNSETETTNTTIEQSILEQSASYKLACRLADKILENNKKITIYEDDVRDWSYDIQDIIDDEVEAGTEEPVDDVKCVIDWCQQNKFWRSRITNGKKFKKHYVKMYGCMMSDD